MTVQQRAYYRMDTMLPLSYRVLTEEESHLPLPAAIDAAFIETHFPSHLSEVEDHIQQAIAAIQEKSSLMANALNAINNKLNYVIQSLGEAAFKHTLPVVAVNLSAGGLSFNSHHHVQAKQLIDLLFFLNIHTDPILVRAQVVKVIPNPDHSNMVAVEFINLSEEIRRQLVAFIQNKELEIAKQKRQ